MSRVYKSDTMVLKIRQASPVSKPNDLDRWTRFRFSFNYVSSSATL